MSDTDWRDWMPTDDSGGQPQQFEDSGQTSSSVDKECQIECDFDELVLFQIFQHFKIKERFPLRMVCTKWRDCVDKSLRTQKVLNSDSIGSGSGLSTKALCLMVGKCCNVRTIDLNGLLLFTSDKWPPQSEDDDNVLVTIVNNCDVLERLDVSIKENIDHIIIQNIEYFRRLKSFASRYIGEEAFNCLLDSPNIETIDISKSYNISRPQFERLGPKISTMVLTESEVSEEEVYKKLCEGNGKYISKLEMDINKKEVLALICQHMTKLEVFKFDLYVQNPNFNHFSNLKCLKHLQMDVTDESSLLPNEFSELILSLKTNLLSLDVKLSPLNNIAITDNSLKLIQQNCRLLEKLVIRGANSLTGDGLYPISQMMSLKHLDLKDCVNITDQITIAITLCPMLRHIVLHNCSHITKATVDAFKAKANTCLSEEFYLDVIDTNVNEESVKESEVPKNVTILYEYDDCKYDCEHGWDQQNGYHSGPEADFDYYDEMDDLDFFDGDDEYDDEDFDYALNSVNDLLDDAIEDEDRCAEWMDQIFACDDDIYEPPIDDLLMFALEDNNGMDLMDDMLMFALEEDNDMDVMDDMFY